jgi:hypothetical protein
MRQVSILPHILRRESQPVLGSGRGAGLSLPVWPSMPAYTALVASPFAKQSTRCLNPAWNLCSSLVHGLFAG